MLNSQQWYIVKKNDGSCEISHATVAPDRSGADLTASEEKGDQKIWGPFSDRQDAIAKRVGLIRAGKCQPQRRE